MNDGRDARPAPPGPRSFAFERLSATATVLDGNGIIVDTNDAWQLFARLNDGAIDKTDLGISYLDVCDLSASMGEGDAAAVATGIRQLLAGERDHFDYEYACASPTEERWFLLQASAAPVGGRRGVVLFHVDITATRIRRQRLPATLGQDELLAIPGRRSGFEHLRTRLAEASRRGVVAVAIIHVTGFEAIDHTYGHHAADEVLVKVAVRIDGLARADDELCRLGGDELLLLCGEATTKDLARTVERVREVLSAPIQVGSAAVPVVVAIGTATNEPGSTVDALVLEATSAMRLDEATRRQASTTPTLGAEGEQQQVDPPDSGWLGSAPAILDSLGDAIVVHDAEDRVLHATPAAATLLDHLSSTSTAVSPGWSVLDDRGGPAGWSRLPPAPDLDRPAGPIVVGLCDPAGALRWLEITTRSIDADPPRPPMFVSRLRPTAPPPDAGTTG